MLNQHQELLVCLIFPNISECVTISVFLQASAAIAALKIISTRAFLLKLRSFSTSVTCVSLQCDLQERLTAANDKVQAAEAHWKELLRVQRADRYSTYQTFVPRFCTVTWPVSFETVAKLPFWLTSKYLKVVKYCSLGSKL